MLLNQKKITIIESDFQYDKWLIFLFLINILIFILNVYIGLIFFLINIFFKKTYYYLTMLFLPLFEPYISKLGSFTVNTYIYLFFIIYFLISQKEFLYNTSKIKLYLVFILFLFSGLFLLNKYQLDINDLFGMLVFIMQLFVALLFGLVISTLEKKDFNSLINTIAISSIPIIFFIGILFNQKSYILNENAIFIEKHVTYISKGSYSVLIVCFIPCLLYILFEQKKVLLKIFSILAFVILFIIIFKMGSRAGLLSLIFIIIMYFLYNLKTLKKKWTNLLSILIISILVVLFISINSDFLKYQYSIKNLDLNLSYISILSNERYRLFLALPDQLFESATSFFIGHGWYSNLEIFLNYKYVFLNKVHHNILAAMLFRTGIIGTSIFLLLSIDIFNALRKATSYTKMPILMFLCLFFGGLFNPIYIHEIFWLAMGFSIGCNIIINKEYKLNN